MLESLVHNSLSLHFLISKWREIITVLLTSPWTSQRLFKAPVLCSNPDSAKDLQDIQVYILNDAYILRIFLLNYYHAHNLGMGRGRNTIQITKWTSAISSTDIQTIPERYFYLKPYSHNNLLFICIFERFTPRKCPISSLKDQWKR